MQTTKLPSKSTIFMKYYFTFPTTFSTVTRWLQMSEVRCCCSNLLTVTYNQHYTVFDVGDVILVADPVIHSMGGNYGHKDGGPDAVDECKRAHICNNICKELGLKAFSL